MSHGHDWCSECGEAHGYIGGVWQCPREIGRAAERDALRARVADLEIALATLLDAAERQAAGFPLPAEQWFAVRDYARARLPEKGKEEVEHA